MHILIVFCSVHTNENTSSGLGFCKEFFLWLTHAQLPIRAQVCNSPPLYKIPGSVPVCELAMLCPIYAMLKLFTTVLITLHGVACIWGVRCKEDGCRHGETRGAWVLSADSWGVRCKGVVDAEKQEVNGYCPQTYRGPSLANRIVDALIWIGNKQISIQKII